MNTGQSEKEKEQTVGQDVYLHVAYSLRRINEYWAKRGGYMVNLSSYSGEEAIVRVTSCRIQ